VAFNTLEIPLIDSSIMVVAADLTTASLAALPRLCVREQGSQWSPLQLVWNSFRTSAESSQKHIVALHEPLPLREFKTCPLRCRQTARSHERAQHRLYLCPRPTREPIPDMLELGARGNPFLGL
jgi:hypothetical protein